MVEFPEKRVVEIFLGLILIILLIGIIFLFTSSSVSGSSTTTTITNSFNTNTYNYYNDEPGYYKNYDDYPKYASRTKYKTIEGFFGDEINHYIVYVKNKEHRGRYFKVRFYFEDYYGDTRTESITKYIKPGDEQKFIYRDINDKYSGDNWRYKVE